MTAPAATIIIPSRGRIDALAQTLAALGELVPAPAWEVIVVDNGSAAAEVRETEALLARLGPRGRLVGETRPGPAAARNRGAAQAQAPLLIFIDNDILVRPDFVALHVEAQRLAGGAWVIGRIVHSPRLRETAFGRYRDAVWERFHEEQGGVRLAETAGMSAANLGVARTQFQELGGFDEQFAIASCEDAELGYRARARGYRIVYDPQNVVLHNDWAITLESFCERQRLYSISDVLLHRKYGERSPRAALLLAMAPRSAVDGPGSRVRKALRAALAMKPLRAAATLFARALGRVSPDSALARRAYDVVVGLAIRDGVREGLRRYGAREDNP